MKLAKIVTDVVNGFQQKLLGLVESLGMTGLSPESFRQFVGDLRQAVDGAGLTALVETITALDSHRETFEHEGQLVRFKFESTKEWLTPFGKASVRRRLYQPDAGGASVIPLDAHCGMRDRYMTPDVEEMALFASAMLVPREVERLLAKTLPCAPSATAIDRLIETVGEFAEAHSEALDEAMDEQAPLSTGGDILAVSWDGVNTPLREDAPMRGRPAERPGVREDETSPTAWKEAGVGTVSIYAAPKKDEKGPQRMDTRYFARMPEPGMERLMREQSATVTGLLDQRAFRHKALICDGKRSIWNSADAMDVYADFTRILDFYHAAEHLSKAAEALFGKKAEKGQRWFAKYRRILRTQPGGARALLRSMQYHRRKLRSNGERYKTTAQVITYFQNNIDKMDYARYRRMGLPIGSGPVEAACKTIVGARLKRSGMRWSLLGGQHVLNLRTPLLSNRWNTFWNCYLQWAA